MHRFIKNDLWNQRLVIGIEVNADELEETEGGEVKMEMSRYIRTELGTLKQNTM